MEGLIMTHLRIEQNESAVEYVSSAVIKKLYDLATSGDLDVTSNLQGTLHAPATYNEYITALTTAYPNLHITATKYYVKFNDPAFQKACAELYGDGIGMTMADFQAVTDEGVFHAFNGNTEITDMTEFKYFTNASISGEVWHTDYLLRDLTNLRKIDFPDHITNIPSVARSNNNLGYKGALMGCTSLTSVHYPNNATDISFYGACTPPILDLRNTKLTGIGFDGVTTMIEIYLPSTMTNIGSRAFFGCSNLKKIVIQEGQQSLIVSSGTHSGMIFGTSDCIVDFPSNTTQLVWAMFRYFASGHPPIFILRATTPPICIDDDNNQVTSTDSMQNSSQIDLYVPDASISAYQSNTLYSGFKHIYGLSQLPASYSQVPASDNT